MRFERAILLIVPLLLGIPVQAGPDDAALPPPPPVEAGLWPSDTMVNLLLARWAAEIGDRYELSDDQRATVADAVRKRWGGFLKEHRTVLQPLVNEFVEMRLGLEPPAKDRVQSWAQRATPMAQRLRVQIDAGSDEFRLILDPGQRVTFEIEALKLGLGFELVEQKLKVLRSGDFGEEDLGNFWQPPRRSKRRDTQRFRGGRADDGMVGERRAALNPLDQIAVELTAWDQYVDEFIRQHGLDEGQRSAVLSCLTELKQRAAAHGDRRRDEIAVLERSIAGYAGDEAELKDLRKQLTELYGPIDDMFQELQRRIEQVPTAQQTLRATGGRAREPGN